MGDTDGHQWLRRKSLALRTNGSLENVALQLSGLSNKYYRMNPFQRLNVEGVSKRQ
jgi:hypothetical protein